MTVEAASAATLSPGDLQTGKAICRPERRRAAALWGGICLLMVLLIFFWRIFPDCYLEGSGLTPFKKVSEYLVCLILLIALLLLFRQRHAFHGQVFRLISLALLAAIGGELFFAAYLNIYGLTNFFGHYFHGLSFLLLYLALVAAQLKRPLDTLFRELNQERQRYATILHTALDGFLITDGQGQILTVNQAYCRMGGYREKELIGQNLAEITVLKEPTATETFWQNLQAQGEGHFEARHRRKNGGLYDVEVSFQYQPIDGGRLIAFLRDISARKQAEQLLRQSEKLLHARLRLSQEATDLSLADLLARVMDEAQALTDSSIGFFHFLEKDQRTLHLQAWSHSTTAHYCRAEGQGRHYPVDQAGVWVDCIRARRAVIHNDYKNLPHRRGLPPGHAEVHREMVVPIFREETIVAIFGVGNKKKAYTDGDVELVTSLGEMAWDIILRQRAEEELRRSEEWSRMQIELALDGILVGSPEGVITRANRSICTMRVLPLTGAPGSVLVSHTDITALKETEESLSATLAEREVLIREVHHRVKNNLAAIVGLLEMQRRVLTDPESREILTELGGRIRSMSLIHEKLYRSENLARIDFQHYLTALISHLRTSYGSVQIQCRSEAVGVEMPLDLAVPCGMIVNELVTNALKYAFPPGWTATGNAGRIRVAISQEKGFYTLSVSDNGIGLPPGFDWTAANTMGMVLIRMLGGHQLGGTFRLEQNGGLSVTLRFPNKRGRK